MAEERILKILFDSDSEEEFLRFTDEDIVQPRSEIIADSDSLDEAPVLVRWCIWSLMASECQAKPAIHQVLDNSSEYDVFWLFITDEMIDLMVVETNRYADQVKEKKGGDATGSLFCALRTPSLSLGQAYR